MFTTHTPMNQQQRLAALRLLAACEGDTACQESAKAYGNWFEHLTDQLNDELAED